MSADIAVRVEGLSKRYRRGAAAERTDSFRDVVSSWARRRAQRAASNDHADDFWALQDVSFEVPRGQVVGIIGRNGAGKSTLLKILSRITAPTSGRAELHGRLGSLLEVGTGFHPELTGRENIFLNGAILGMPRQEIHRKLDEIIEWSGVGAFVDTPVKRFSSGMRVRLAFAVAAHLEPEILIVDEVLAVGDAEFQRKCLGKMGEVAREGRTVLFVSHNMNAILNLCSRGIIMQQGRVEFDGETEAAASIYAHSVHTPVSGFVELDAAPQREATGPPIIKGLGLRPSHSQDHVCRVNTGDDLSIDIHYDCGDRTIDVAQVGISTTTGQRLFTLGTHLSTDAPERLTGRGVITCQIHHLPLAAGEYDVSVMMTNRIPWHEVDCIESALRFEVETNDYFGTGLRPGTEQGPIAHRSRWTVSPAELEPSFS